MTQYLFPQFSRIATLLLLVLFWFPTITYGQSNLYKTLREFGGELFNISVYDPHSKSYFGLYRIQRGSYENANNYARSRIFKGARGRLAVVRSKETQNFIARTFRPPNETWIGLRMFCQSRKLRWVTGEELVRGKHFTNWGRRWRYDDKYTPCAGPLAMNTLFAGIALVRDDYSVVRWWAIAPDHFTTSLLIEFPTKGR